MVDRLLLSLAIALLVTVALLALRFVHLRRATRLSVRMSAGDERPTILYFRGDHCGPCQAQSYHLRQLERELGDRLAVQEIDAERDGDLADHYGIFTLPTTLVTDGGGQVKHINYGLAAATTLARQLESVL
ncbi:MAG TPA: thioredoxin family protein [Anaerolineae bacterium]|jgi:thioredoxin 1|nr:thioredoxin family protein [Anaerolineae bacterium]